MNVAMSVGLAFAAILGAYLFVLWYASAGVIDHHEDRITVMEKRWTEQFGGPEPAAEDSSAAEEQNAAVGTSAQVNVEEQPGDDCPTLPDMPALPGPATQPDGIPLQVQSALLRPSPVPRGAEMVERTVNIGGTLQTFRIPANREAS